MVDLIAILVSVTVGSLVAFIGILFIGLKEAFLRRILMALIGFASGSLIGGSFIYCQRRWKKLGKLYSTT